MMSDLPQHQREAAIGDVVPGELEPAGGQGDPPLEPALRDLETVDGGCPLQGRDRALAGDNENAVDDGNLDARGVRWGIVTNKASRLTDPLVAQLGLEERAVCVVSGDTTPHSKPHPAPLLHAAQEMAIPPERIVYVGDDLRDVQAGFAAGMVTVAAAYGYCGTDLPPAKWHANHIVQSAAELQRLLRDIT